MNPHFTAEILAMTTAELAERNGAELLAHQLQAALRDRQAESRAHAEEMAAYVAANRAGLAIYHYVRGLHRNGRKSAWVHDLMGIYDTEMSKR